MGGGGYGPQPDHPSIPDIFISFYFYSFLIIFNFLGWWDGPPPSLKVENRAPPQEIPGRKKFFHVPRSGPNLGVKEGGGSAAPELTIHHP